MPKKGTTRETTPKGLNPPGTASPIRNQEGSWGAKDTPIEVPVYVTYTRHTGGKSGKGGLLGWTIDVNCFTFGETVKVKIMHADRKVQVWFDNQKVGESTKQPKTREAPPFTVRELALEHAAVKRTDQRRQGIDTSGVKGKKKAKQMEEDDDIDWEDA